MGRVLSFRCRGCGEKVEVEEEYAGRTVSCPFCAKRAKVVIPTGNGKSARPSNPPGRIKFACGSCGQRHYAEAARAGEKIQCEGCGTRLRIPGAPLPASQSGPVPLPMETTPTPAPVPAARRPSKPTRPPEPTPDEAPASLDVYGFGDPVAKPGGDNGPGAEEEGSSLVMPLPSRAHMAPSTFSASPGGDSPKKRKRKKQQAREEMMGFLAFGLGAVAVMAALIGVGIAMPNLRFGLALFLIIPGAILTLLGNAAFQQVIREEGFFQMLLCRFVPLYIVWFAARRWGEVKDHITLYMLGMCLLGPGLLLMWLSPELHGARDNPFRSKSKDNPAAKAPANPGMDEDEIDPDDL